MHVPILLVDFIQQIDVNAFPWPARSPYLNRTDPAQTLAQLMHEVVVARNEVPQADIDHFILSALNVYRRVFSYAVAKYIIIFFRIACKENFLQNISFHFGFFDVKFITMPRDQIEQMISSGCHYCVSIFVNTNAGRHLLVYGWFENQTGCGRRNILLQSKS